MRRVGVKQKYILIVVIIISLVAVIGLAARNNRRTVDPQTLFYQALQNNLTQTGLTCTGLEMNKDIVTRQAISLNLVSRSDLRAITTITQSGTTITTEEIANKTDDYVRYTTIKTTRKTPDGKKPDFSKALNIWSQEAIQEQQSSLFGRTSLGNCIVPLAHLSGTQVVPLMSRLKQGEIFKTDYNASIRSKIHGISVRTYDIAVQPRPYIDFMKQVGATYGLNDLDAVTAEDFDLKQPQKLKFIIATDSGHLQRIEYTGRQHSIEFSDYGKVPRLKIPKATVTPAELKSRLQAH